MIGSCPLAAAVSVVADRGNTLWSCVDCVTGDAVATELMGAAAATDAVSAPRLGLGAVAVGDWDGAARFVTGGAVGCSAGAANSSAVVAELVFAPPVLCTNPNRGSAVEVIRAPLVELGTMPDRGSVADDDDKAVADSIGDTESVDDVVAVVFGEEDVESDGSATATHGVPATAVPMPSVTASAPTRPIYFA